MKKLSQKEAARLSVERVLRPLVENTKRVLKINGSGYCITYRRERHRLLRLALRAVGGKP